MKGQSLIEVLIAVAVGVIMVVAAVVLLTPLRKTSTTLHRSQVSSTLAKELLENILALGEADWHQIYTDTGKGAGNTYYINTSTSPFGIIAGPEPITVSGISYTRHFYVENVARDGSGVITGVCIIPDCGDPSTQKVTVVTSWSGAASPKTISQYILRSQNNSFVQNDWAGGPGETTPIPVTSDRFDTSSGVDVSSAPGSIILQGF